MIYVKHRVLGNRHVPESEQAALEADGWVKFPRTAEQIAACPDFYAPPEGAIDLEPPKRKPGRPRKESP